MYTIEEISSKVAPIAASYGINQLSVFGSYARRDASQQSDIDFRIVDDGDLRGLIMLAGFCRELNESLKVPVDVLTNDAMSPAFLERIRNEEVIIYG
ncbi:MAG: nucleotidyltransferase domain-containing protein [Coriobacteriia bacterium]|nr:nucleotidyltransferase domain-containing protein [Coriobacteriia bacterium]